MGYITINYMVGIILFHDDTEEPFCKAIFLYVTFANYRPVGIGVTLSSEMTKPYLPEALSKLHLLTKLTYGSVDANLSFRQQTIGCDIGSREQSVLNF